MLRLHCRLFVCWLVLLLEKMLKVGLFIAGVYGG